MATKLNVNIRTLLLNCEELSQDETNFWRLKKFIRSLEAMIVELKELDNQKSSDQITEYIRRLQALKAITNFTDSSPTTSNVRSKLNSAKISVDDDVVLEMRQLQNSKHYTNLRRELLNGDTIRRRKFDQDMSDSIGEAEKYYNEAQEKLTEHMLSLTRNLKEQTETANRIIKKDTEIVSRSAGMTDSNINSLNKETEKLNDHSRNAWKCWMWLMIVFVIAIFIGMVLFMKIMKKRT